MAEGSIRLPGRAEERLVEEGCEEEDIDEGLIPNDTSSLRFYEKVVIFYLALVLA